MEQRLFAVCVYMLRSAVHANVKHVHANARLSWSMFAYDKFWVETILLKITEKCCWSTWGPNSWKHQDKTRDQQWKCWQKQLQWLVRHFTEKFKQVSVKAEVLKHLLISLLFTGLTDIVRMMRSPCWCPLRECRVMSNSRQSRDWKSEQLRAHSPVCAVKTAFV